MEKTKGILQLVLFALLGYVAHLQNPQYQFPNDSAEAQAEQTTIIERPRYQTGSGAHLNSVNAFAHWAQAYQQRLHQGELTAER